MDAFLNASGRGRRVKLEPQPLTYRLLLQLEYLRHKCSATWSRIEDLFSTVVLGEPLQGFSLKNEVEGALREGKQLETTDLQPFLSANVEDRISCRNVGPHLAKCGIRRQHLLNTELLKEVSLPQEITNGLVVDVSVFTNSVERSPSIHTILASLGVDLRHLSDQQLWKKVRDIMSRYKSLSKSAHRPTGKQNLERFLLEKPFETDVYPANTKVVPGPNLIAVTSAQRTAASLRRQLEEQETDLNMAREENKTLLQVVQEKNNALENLECSLQSLHQEAKTLKRKNREAMEELQRAKQTIKQIRQTNFYRRLQRKERDLKRKEATLRAHDSGDCDRVARCQRRKIKLLQTQVSNAKSALQKLKASTSLKTAQLQQALTDLQPQQPIQLTKDDSNEYSEDIKKTTISLIAAQVSAEKCPYVIQAVARYLFHREIPIKALPSERTVRRFADQGHVLGKLQVAEAVVHSKFDLHVDGTSRDKKRFVGQQVTTAEGSLSCGFTTVSSENARTLVDTTLDLLGELADVYSPAEREHHFRRILQNLAGVMSDRAAVMKKFKVDLQEAIQATLGTQESIEFLYCNAHFLLGLSNNANNTLQSIQQDRGELRIGRDEQPIFHRFTRAEAAAVRYVRMACEVLGPRGDEKSGCRDAWLAFCSISGRSSRVTSFKSNRFNNLFEAAAALHFHRASIIDFLDNFLPEKNQKLESVLYDAKSDAVGVYVLTLAMVFFRITGPYWQLLGTKTHYLDFFQHVVALRAQLQEWTTEADSIFTPDLPSLFEKPPTEVDMFGAALAVPQDVKAKVTDIFAKLCGGLLVVVDTQLTDFLPGGQYHNVQDLAMRQKLAHSHITNLVGEACFGDLDLSIYKRRNASSHHHGTLTMLMRNRMMDRWFAAKSEETQSQLLKLSAKKAPELRRKHREMEKEVTAQRRLALQQHHQQMVERKAALSRRKDAISRQLQQHSGPCRTPADVDRLLQRFQLQRERKSALQAEISYHKVVLEQKSPLLRTSQLSVDGLADNLRQYLVSLPEHAAAVDPPCALEGENSASIYSVWYH